MMTLTQEERELFAYIDTLMVQKGKIQYDFNDPRQYAFAKLMASLSGSSTKYPGVLKTLDNMRKCHIEKKRAAKINNSSQNADNWQDVFGIPELTLRSDGTIGSTGFATVVGGYSSMNLTLLVQSRKTKDIVANGFECNFATTSLNVNTAPSASNEIDVDAYMHYLYTTSNEDAEEPCGGVVKRENTSIDTNKNIPVLEAPVRNTSKPLNPNAINIGLGRPWSDQGGTAQFDYVWDEPTQDHPIGKIPFVGHAVFPKAIKTPLKLNKTFFLEIYVADETGGGGATLNVDDYDSIAQRFSIDADNPAQLNWNLPPGESAKDPGNPIVFKNIPWSSDILAKFFCEIAVVLSDGNFSVVNIISSDSSSQGAYDGTLQIMPIDFVWHCLAGETMISMEDGSKKAIKDIKAGDKVLIKGQNNGSVLWTNRGAHKGNVLKIRTNKGREITASHNHVFFSENEPKTAEELQVGEPIAVIDGTDIISEITSETSGDLLMCNLGIQEYQNPAKKNLSMGTFYANGFLVGDVNAQRILNYTRKRDIAWIKHRVPSYLHKDVDAFFENRE